MLKLQLLNDVTSLKSTDNATPIRLGIFDEESKPVPLTPYKSVEVKLATAKGMYLFDEPCTVDPVDETLEFIMGKGVPAGRYIIEVHLRTQDDKLHIAPNEGKYILTIEKSMNEVGTEIPVISVEKLLADMEETLAKADEAMLLASNANSKSDVAVNQSNVAIDIANEAKLESAQAKTDSATALENSNQAKIDSEKAKTDSAQALDQAIHAVEVADSAITKATDAENIANEAKLESSQAKIDSATAIENAENSLVIANEAKVESDSANTKATNAENMANQSKTESTTALAKSSEALANSEESLAIATQAKTDSIAAKTDATEALKVANEAKTLVDGAVVTSNQAKGDADKAKLDASEALTTANQSIADSTQAKTDSAEALKVANEAKVESAAAKLESSKSVTDSSNAISIAQTIEAKFNELTTGNTNNEVIDARKTYATLNDRLNAQDTFMTQLDEALPAYVDEKVLELKTKTEARLDSIELSMQTAPSYVYSKHQQKFIADGTQSDYVVTVATIEENDVVYVYQNGIKLTIDDYTLSGNTVTIIPVLNADTEVYVEVLKRELATGSNENEGALNVDLSKYYLKSDVDVLIANLQSQIDSLQSANPASFSLSNYNAVDSYWTKIGEGAETFTFNNQCTGFAIANQSENDITVTIGSITFVVAANQSFEDNFKPFTELTIDANGDYKAIVHSNVTVTNPDDTGYNAVNSYWTSNGNGTENYSFTEPCTEFEISNTGEAAIVVKIGDVEFVVNANESFADSFTPFTELTITASTAYKAIVRTNTPVPTE